MQFYFHLFLTIQLKDVRQRIICLNKSMNTGYSQNKNNSILLNLFLQPITWFYPDGFLTCSIMFTDSLLPSGSDEEIEIRGCSIHSVELLKQRLQNRIEAEQISAEVPNSSLIDYYLWSYRRKHAKELENVPYHKTLGIYY